MSSVVCGRNRHDVAPPWSSNAFRAAGQRTDSDRARVLPLEREGVPDHSDSNRDCSDLDYAGAAAMPTCTIVCSGARRLKWWWTLLDITRHYFVRLLLLQGYDERFVAVVQGICRLLSLQQTTTHVISADEKECAALHHAMRGLLLYQANKVGSHIYYYECTKTLQRDAVSHDSRVEHVSHGDTLRYHWNLNISSSCTGILVAITPCFQRFVVRQTGCRVKVETVPCSSRYSERSCWELSGGRLGFDLHTTPMTAAARRPPPTQNSLPRATLSN
jgi:hypothetical protein